MYLGVLGVLTSVILSLALSTDDKSCMVPVADPSAIFNQDSATNATVSISEWTGETNETCNAKCCQSGDCTVAVFDAAQQRCQLFACQQLKSCTLRIGEGVAIFARQVNIATTLSADVITQSGTTTVSTDTTTIVVMTKATDNNATISPPDTTTTNGGTTTAVLETSSSNTNSTTPNRDTTTPPVGTTISTTPQSLEILSIQLTQTANSTTPVSTSASIGTSTAKEVQESMGATTLPTVSINSNSLTQGEQQSVASQSLNVSLSTLTPPTQSPVEINVTPNLQSLQDSTDTTIQGTTTTARPLSDSASTDPISFAALSTIEATTTTPPEQSAAPGSPPNAVNQTQPPPPASSNDKPLTDAHQDTQTSAETTPAEHIVQPNKPETVPVDDVTTAQALQDSTTTITTENSQEITSLPEGNATTQEADPLNTGVNLTLSESKEIASKSSLTVADVRQVKDMHQSMVVILVCTLSFGCVFLLVVVGVLGRRIYEGYQKRHYSRLDYLINGMYS